MNKFLVNLICRFIPQSKNRKHFRDKYRFTKDYKKSCFEMLFLSEDTRDNISSVISVKKLLLSSVEGGGGSMNVLRNVDLKDYDTDVKKMKENLSIDEIQKLEHILKRAERELIGHRDIYTEQELFKYAKMHSIHKSIKQENGYYQLYNYKLPINNFEPSIFYDKYKLNEIPSIYEKTKDKAIFDIGGYCGDSALILKEFFPNNRLYIVECMTSGIENINKTIELNNLQDVIPVHCAMGNGQCDSIKIPTSYNKEEQVKMTTLDKYVKDNNVHVGLIKTDIEGAEWDFLQGSIETIKSQKPILVISIYHNYRDFFKIKPFIESLNMEYQFSFCDSCYGVNPIHEITLNCF